MVKYKSFNDIILDMLDYLKLTQPNLDIKPNSVSRDLFVDSQAVQVSKIYDALKEVSSLQSISNLTGKNLLNYGSNFGVNKRPGSKAYGSVVCTFRDLSMDVSIPAGSIFRTRNGLSFVSISTVFISPLQSNSLRANALRLRQNLDTAGIDDEFAIEVSVEAQSVGSVGNISTYAITQHNISGVNSVTNVVGFVGGTDLETDSLYRSRILATFAGTNMGTALAYRSIILGLASAMDALVVEPGDPLLVRDGTVVYEDSNGTKYVSEPGTGGKVDIYVMGESNASTFDSFIYADKSGTNSPSNQLNDYVLGLGDGDLSLTLNSRRMAVFNGLMDPPQQPVSKIVYVSGSVSGPNFIEQYMDSLGELKGNYKLVKDFGNAAGSVFGLDKFVWTSDKIELEGESIIKGVLNSVDGVAFTDLTTIKSIEQDVQVVNENSSVSGTSRNFVTLKHKPVRTTSRVYNLTTGERYIVTDQSPDDDGSINYSGRIKISGKTLPTASDVLQVDYVWIKKFDEYYDFDNLNPRDISNQSQDSVDWGYSNYIRDEKETVKDDGYGNLYLETDFKVNRLLSINSYASETATVIGSGSLGKTIKVSSVIDNIHSIKDITISGKPEVYNTDLANGSFSNLVIILPTDSIAQIGDEVEVIYNLKNIISDVVGGEATFSNYTITLTPSTIIPAETDVLLNYVASFYNLLPQTNISSLPISGDGFNSFIDVSAGNQPIQNNYVSEEVVSNQRRAPSQLKVTVNSIPNNGIIRCIGTTINKVEASFVVTAQNSIDLAPYIKVAEGTDTLPSGISIARVVSVKSGEKTATGEFGKTISTYDLTNYEILNSKWDMAKAIKNSALSNTQFKLSETKHNYIDNPIITGTFLKVIFYYAKENDYEDLFFSRNGSAITNKVFGYVSYINRFYGMQDSAGTTLGNIRIDSFNQPENNSAYDVDYDYIAPKENERITISFEYNKLISDATEAIEAKRPITSDILVKSATKILLDAEVSIVVLPSYINNAASVKQEVSDVIVETLSATSLATIIDSSDIINNIYSVAGVDRARVIRFNKQGETGTKLSIEANKSEYFAPGNIIVNSETR